MGCLEGVEERHMLEGSLERTVDTPEIPRREACLLSAAWFSGVSLHRNRGEKLSACSTGDLKTTKLGGWDGQCGWGGQEEMARS